MAILHPVQPRYKLESNYTSSGAFAHSEFSSWGLAVSWIVLGSPSGEFHTHVLAHRSALVVGVERISCVFRIPTMMGERR